MNEREIFGVLAWLEPHERDHVRVLGLAALQLGFTDFFDAPPPISTDIADLVAVANARRRIAAATRR